MGLKDLQKLKKTSAVEEKIINKPYLVVGCDIFALSFYNQLKNKVGPEKVVLLSNGAFPEGNLFPKGPSSFRGETNQKMFKYLYPHVQISRHQENALFYKDLSWKSFGGRSRPEILKYDEAFYTGGRLDVDWNEIFLDKNKNVAREEIVTTKIKGINKVGESYVVYTQDGSEFHCEHLYFGHSPYSYLQFYLDKKELSSSFIEFCESTKTTAGLFVKYVFPKAHSFMELQETLFIPLSYTHEWGHFIGEFKNKSEIEFLYFLDEEASSEEDVSKAIRLLKKNLEKIFPLFFKNNFLEFISLEEEMSCLKIDDELYQNFLSEKKGREENLFFIGVNAPLGLAQSNANIFEYSPESLNGAVRALYVEAKLLKKFHS